MTPEQIAAGLTEAQRAFVLDLSGDGGWKEFSAHLFSRFGANALRGFGKSGLIEGVYQNPAPVHRLTPLGLAVRAILQDHQP
jgi:hypothetical protein